MKNKKTLQDRIPELPQLSKDDIKEAKIQSMGSVGFLYFFKEDILPMLDGVKDELGSLETTKNGMDLYIKGKFHLLKDLISRFDLIITQGDK